MRIAQGAVLLLQLGEHAYVLNGDDGLPGERVKEGNLRIREGANLTPPDTDGADGAAFSEHRDSEDGAAADPVTGGGPVSGFGGEIFYVYDPPLHDSPSGHTFAGQGHRERFSEPFQYGFFQPILGHEGQLIAIRGDHAAKHRLAEQGGASCNHVEYWLHVGRRR